MKLLAILICIFFGSAVWSQFSKQEIALHKINRFTSTYHSPGADDYVLERVYDKMGNETATYEGGRLKSTITYQYNTNGRPVSHIKKDSSGKELETAVYEYAADGSCKMSNSDAQFHLTNYEWYDKSGRLVKTGAPDGSVIQYTYNAAGKLLTIKSPEGTNGVVVDNKYTYDAKGRLLKDTRTGEFPSVTTYKYGAGKLPESCVMGSGSGDDESATRISFTYVFFQ